MAQFQKHRFLAVICFLVLWAALSSQALTSEVLIVSFEDLPALLKEKGALVKASQLETESKRKETGHLGRSFLPELNVTAGGEAFKTAIDDTGVQPYGSATLSANLFRGGRDQLADKERNLSANLSEANQEETFRQELVILRRLYWEIVSQKEEQKFNADLLAETQRIRKVGERRVARGVSTSTDLLEFELLEKNLEEDIVGAKHEEGLLLLAMKTRLGLTKEQSVEVVGLIPHEHDEALFQKQEGLDHHPKIEARRLEAERKGLLAKEERRWWIPSLDAYGTYELYDFRERNFDDWQDRQDLAAGVRMNWRIFDGLQSYRKAQSLQFQSLAEGSNALHQTRLLSWDRENAQEEMIHFHQLIHSSEDKVSKGRQLLKRVFNEYERGVKDSRDVLATLSDVAKIEREYLQRRSRYQENKAALLALLGK